MEPRRLRRRVAGLATAEGVKAGFLINATRVAIVGRAVAPPLFETMVGAGKERVVGGSDGRCRRFQRAEMAFWLGELLIGPF